MHGAKEELQCVGIKDCRNKTVIRLRINPLAPEYSFKF